MHVDAFPGRPTHGGRILRVFANIKPQPRAGVGSQRAVRRIAKNSPERRDWIP